MNRVPSATRRLYVPHVDGTLTGSPSLAGGRLPALTDLTHAREFLASYFDTHPVDAAAHPLLAICEVDATITLRGQLTFPVDRDQALTQPHRQVVTVGPLQRPHPRALAVTYSIARWHANAVLHDPNMNIKELQDAQGAVTRARNAVQVAWQHGHDVAYANSWRALASVAETMGYWLAATGPSVRTPAPPPRLLQVAAWLAGRDQIVEIIEQAWRSGLAHGGRRGTAHAAGLLTGGQTSALGSAVTAITAEWTNPHLAQLASELAALGRTPQHQRSAVVSRLDTYLSGWQLADAAAARPTTTRFSPQANAPPTPRLPPPPAVGTSVRRGPTR